MTYLRNAVHSELCGTTCQHTHTTIQRNVWYYTYLLT